MGSCDWDALELDGDACYSDSWLLGGAGGEVLALVNYGSFFATGGRWSNRDPKGYYDVGGGAVFNVGPGTESRPVDYADGRLNRGDSRAAVVSGDGSYVQNLDGEVARVDIATGEATTLAATPHLLSGDTAMAANEETLFYARGGWIYGLDLTASADEPM